MQMARKVIAGLVALGFAGAWLSAQQPARPMSPEGSTQTQVLGAWTKGERPTFALGRENYVGGKWIEITYGRPLQRGRDLFGSGPNYGKAINDVGTANLPAPPVWRAGANVSTRLKTEVPLNFAGKTGSRRRVQPVHRLERSDAVDAHRLEMGVTAEVRSERQERAVGRLRLHRRQGRRTHSHACRKPPFGVEQLTWSFLDMTNDGGRIALMWGKTMASASFKAGS